MSTPEIEAMLDLDRTHLAITFGYLAGDNLAPVQRSQNAVRAYLGMVEWLKTHTVTEHGRTGYEVPPIPVIESWCVL